MGTFKEGALPSRRERAAYILSYMLIRSGFAIKEGEKNEKIQKRGHNRRGKTPNPVEKIVLRASQGFVFLGTGQKLGFSEVLAGPGLWAS